MSALVRSGTSFPSFVAFLRNVLDFKPSDAQRVFSAVAFDGANPCELAGKDRALASKIFGAADQFPEESRRTVLLVGGRGSGKTVICCYRLVHLALTVDVSGTRPGEAARAVVVAQDVRTAKVVLKIIRGALEFIRRCSPW